jgi:hypothetical protein
MKAVRYYGQKDLRVDEIPVPDLKGDQVKVSSKQVGFILANLIELINRLKLHGSEFAAQIFMNILMVR